MKEMTAEDAHATNTACARWVGNKCGNSDSTAGIIVHETELAKIWQVCIIDMNGRAELVLQNLTQTCLRFVQTWSCSRTKLPRQHVHNQMQRQLQFESAVPLHSSRTCQSQNRLQKVFKLSRASWHLASHRTWLARPPPYHSHPSLSFPKQLDDIACFPELKLYTYIYTIDNMKFAYSDENEKKQT